MVDIEKLVSEAREYVKEMGDDKAWCETNEMVALLKVGAIPIEINQEQAGGETYSHTVSYEGIAFTNTTTEPVQELKKYQVRH